MYLKVKKDLVIAGVKEFLAGRLDGVDFIKSVFPNTHAALMVKPYPKLMIKRYNKKTGDWIGRVCLFLSATEGRVVFKGNGKYEVGSNGSDIKVEYYEDIDDADIIELEENIADMFDNE
jgi:hypothetical protein